MNQPLPTAFHPERFEDLLKDSLDRVLAGAGRTGTPPNLAESIRYSLLAPGKRIRPQLVYAAAALTGTPVTAMESAAVAIEMIHCFTLIHDDLPCMDDDDFRRGLPSNHRKFGEATALLAGDALLAAAFEIFANALPHVAPAAFARAFSRLTWAAGPRGVIGGQAAEMLLNSSSQLEDLRAMHAGKTGALFLAPILIPVDFSGLAPETPEFQSVEAFARELGLAFQVADDLDDAAQDEGKPLNVLYFMPAEEARRQSLAGLHSATKRLQQTWGEKASALGTISARVARSL